MTLNHVAARTGNNTGNAEISILLTDDDQIRQFNARYRGVDRPTNVLAFPGAMDDTLSSKILSETETGSAAPIRLLGDIVLAYETVTAEARDQNKGIGDHLIHLVVHGLLHLLGHDHQQEQDADYMEALEAEILIALGLADPYVEADTRRESRTGGLYRGGLHD